MPLSNPIIAVVGAGRLGTVLASELAAGTPRLRGATCDDADIVLLCVPDEEIANAAAALTVRRGRMVGHCSGATTLTPLTERGHEAFSLHPLMTVTAEPAELRGGWAAVSGSTAAATQVARDIVARLGMRAFDVADDDRAAYHASASIASNFLITLESFAERMGTERELLVPLVRATVENWAALGPQRALTGPVARGDEATVQAQRDAVVQRAPDLVELFDCLVKATEDLAHGIEGDPIRALTGTRSPRTQEAKEEAA